MNRSLSLESLENRQLLAVDVVQVESVQQVHDAVVAEDPRFDLNGDEAIDSLDLEVIVEGTLGTRLGDLNLDGRVDFSDFLRLSASFGQSGASYANGDTNGDGVAAFDDFLVMSSNFGFVKQGRMIDIRIGATHIPTREVFDRLAASEDVPGALGVSEIKFVLELERGEISFLNQNQFSLHYQFAVAALGYQGSPAQFNNETYFTGNRRFVVGSILAHDHFEGREGQGIYTLEYWPTDPVTADHIAETMSRLLDAAPFLEGTVAYHPASETHRQLHELQFDQFVQNNIPVIQTEELFGNQTFAALNEGVAFGRLVVIDGTNVGPLTQRDVVIFENIPNDLTHVAGVITVQPQTPLSHVNLRAKQNDSPNAYIKDALTDPVFQNLIGSNVRFEVINNTFTIRAASTAEVDQHLEAIRPTSAQEPIRDLTQTKIAALSSLRTPDQDAYGAKAANLGELQSILPPAMVPSGLAVPFSLYDEYMRDNGLYEVAEQMMATASFRTNPERRESMLELLRNRIENGIVSDKLRTELDVAHEILKQQFGADTNIRARSSTNNEDLIGFTGAGLYRSYTHRPDEGKLDKTIRQVWASLWTFRAYEEREFWRIDHLKTAMGVALHPSFKNEQANGVAVTKNIFDPNWRGYYVNVQVGEDLVTNPEGNAVPEEFLVSAIGERLEPETQYIRFSNLLPFGETVLTQDQIDELVTVMRDIHFHFVRVYEEFANRDFAMDLEFKIDASGQLVIKQARPWVD